MPEARSKTSALRSALRRALRERGAVLWYAVGVSASLIFCYLLLPAIFALFLLGRAVQRATGAPHRGFGVNLLGGFALSAVLAIPVAAIAATLQFFPGGDGPTMSAVLGMAVAACLGGALMGPFVTTSAHLFRRGDLLVDAVAHAIAASGMRGVGPTLLRGAIVGLVIAAAPAYGALLASVGPTGYAEPLAVVTLFALVPMLLAWLIGFVGASADEDDEQLTEASPPLGWRTRWPFVVPAASLVFAMLTAGLAALSPLPAWQPAPLSLRECASELHAVPPHGLEVVPAGFEPIEMHPPVPDLRAPRAFMVSTADGGGAGLVYGPSFATPDVICPAPGDDGWVLRFEPGLGVPIDSRGVRRDDAMTYRLSRRLGLVFPALLLLGVLCLFIATRALGGRFALLRALDGSEESLRSLGGRLELDEGAMLVRDGMSGKSRGDARLVSSDGATRVRLPGSLTIVGRVAPEAIENLPSGTPARLLSVEPIGSSTHRSAVEDWPRSGVLSVGPQNDARAALMGAIARAAATWVVGASLAFGAAGCWVLFQI